ncbi:DUF1836 domain-containing protein [Paenibacillus protaetiae]|uniref:DUF1836 domain-containing protein n=1 Tax=Paenibacillus protaetiae TaxID=2509456 RepID=A0A4P6F4H0_9BACL|nr:DUF1836 domain-containing protein [Paenibacillus protaetiae]QAY68077.1 DUF1836 domain-containing protein [Paenibacillus protaetiae]
MESFILTRKDMAKLLLALNGQSHESPLQVLQASWTSSHLNDQQQGSAMPAFLSTSLPPVIEKLIKGTRVKGFSLQEIAALGRLIEYSGVSLTAMQNWVKRDFKPYFDCPKVGKKYSINQAALLFIIDDLKYNLDFESIRKLFCILFNKPEDENDDLVGPVSLYEAYSDMFEQLDATHRQIEAKATDSENYKQDFVTEQMVLAAANRYARTLPELTGRQREAVRNFMLIAAVSIQTAYCHSVSKRYFNATMFL